MLTDGQFSRLIKGVKNEAALINFFSTCYGKSGGIPDLHAPHILKMSLDNLETEMDAHIKLIKQSSPRLIEKFVPGLFSCYFNVIKKSKKCPVKEAIHTVLNIVTKLSVLDQRVIHDFFYYNEVDQSYAAIFRRLSDLSSTEYKFLFLSRLVVWRVKLSESEYLFVNEEMFSDTNFPWLSDLVGALITGGKFLLDPQLIPLSNLPNSIIEQIQAAFVSRIPRPILHLCPYNEHVVDLLPNYNVDELELFFMRHKDRINGMEAPLPLLCKYLHHQDVGTTTFFKSVSVEKCNYDLVMDYAGENLSDPLVLRNMVKYMYSPRLHSFISDVLNEIDNSANDALKCFRYLDVIYLLLIKDELSRADMKEIFEGLIYLDGPVMVKMAVYKVLGTLLVQYGRMDKYIEHKNKAKAGEGKGAHPNSKVLASADDIQCCTLIDEYKNIRTRIAKEDYETIRTDNARVFAARMWDELKTYTKPNLLFYIVEVLTKIIEATEYFYEGRLQSSGFLIFMIDSFERNVTTNSVGKETFSKLVLLVSRFFKLDKRHFERCFELCESYFDERHSDEVLKNLVIKDRYFAYYLCKSTRSKALRRRTYSLLRKIITDERDARRSDEKHAQNEV